MNRMNISLILCSVLVGTCSYLCGDSKMNESASAANFVTTASGLQYRIVKMGAGLMAELGNRVGVHYTGWLWNKGAKGFKFDSSVGRGQPFSFRLGAGEVIRGWDEGVAGMKVGEIRELIIPAPLAYGPRGVGGFIPPSSTLFFEVELLDVSNG